MLEKNIDSDNIKINIRKEINRDFNMAKKNIKPEKCILCGKNQTSFCNSHSVPQMALKEISENGKVLQASAVMNFDFEIFDIEKGIRNSGVFNYICKECDSKFFKDYEDPQNLLNEPNDKILAEIAVKNFLLELNKKAVAKEVCKMNKKIFINLKDMINILELDYKECLNEILFHKDIVDNNKYGGYQILYWKILPYKIPIATQCAIVLKGDLNGNLINDSFDFSENIRMQFLHLCILPLKEESVVLAFYHKRDKAYRNLRHQFNSISEDKKLQFLNYLIFSYTENYFISKRIENEIKSNGNLQKLSLECNGIPNFGTLGVDNNFGLGYTPVSYDDIPNFLSSEWAL